MARHIDLAAKLFVFALYCLHNAALAKNQVFTKESKASPNSICKLITNHAPQIVYVKPVNIKGDDVFTKYISQCPGLFQKERWMGGDSEEFDEYAIYESPDAQASGPVKILYRSFSKLHFTVYINSGQQQRLPDGIEETSQLYQVNFESCEARRVYSKYGQVRLATFAGELYLINTDKLIKQLSVYKAAGMGLDSNLNEVCNFPLTKKRVGR